MFFLNIVEGECQIERYNKLDLHPVSPSAFQFLKYTEMPVSEYSGIPSINIPIYNISVDDVNIPVQLTYHSNGIRTTQEASWVGLGWDLQFGCIVQTINDCDDFIGKTIGNGQVLPNIRRIPDFIPSNGDGTPFKLPLRYLRPGSDPAQGWSHPYPIAAPRYEQGFAISTMKYLPVNGQYDSPELGVFDANNYNLDPNVDSEPDIFSASIFGETIKFVTDLQTSSLVVLNRNDYFVQKTQNGFKISSRSGCHYFFELRADIENYSTSTSFEGYGGSSSFEITSRLFYLTKVVTKNNQEIVFEYVFNGKHDTYPQYSEKYQKFIDKSISNIYPNIGFGSYFFSNANGNTLLYGVGIAKTYSLGKEDKYHLQAISFPHGRIDISLTGRDDMLGEKKVSSISVSNLANLIIKKWDFGYSYFESNSSITDGYTYPNGTSLNSEERSRLRLKLDFLQEVNGGKYVFSYNPTILPLKNSKSQDYWGFYGSGSTLIPSSEEIGHPEIGIVGGTRLADVNSTSACILTEIKYPTGGKVQFQYELNQFDAEGMLGFISQNQVLSGCGLRVKDIIHIDNVTGKVLKVNYTYANGILLSPKRVYRTVPYVRLLQYTGPTNNRYEVESSTLVETSANGVFTSNPLASSSGVGYGVVTKREFSSDGSINGRIDTYYHNYKDSRNTTIENLALYCSLPTTPAMMNTLVGQPRTMNGSPFKKEYYNSLNKIVKKVEYSYSTSIPFMCYGVRIFHWGWLNFVHNYINDNLQQHLIGYYPIFYVRSLEKSSVSIEYDEDESESISTITNNEIGVADLIKSRSSLSSTGGIQNQRNSIVEYFEYPPDYPNDPSCSLLLAKGRIDELYRVKRSEITVDYNNYPTWNDQVVLTNEFAEVGNQVVKSSTRIDKHSGNNQHTEITNYNLYDEKANLLEYTQKGQTSSFIWGYDKEYVTAEILNSAISDCAYSSFETSEKGGFSYVGITQEDLTAPTGKRVYFLVNDGPNININITKTVSPSKKYIVTLWKEASKTVVVNNEGPQHIIKQIGNWVLCEYRVENASMIDIGGEGKIDEVRLYPEMAQMNTYTYEPLIGMTSKCDVNNMITYYEYDELGRLKIVRDENKNVIKLHSYQLGQ